MILLFGGGEPVAFGRTANSGEPQEWLAHLPHHARGLAPLSVDERGRIEMGSGVPNTWEMNSSHPSVSQSHSTLADDLFDRLHTLLQEAERSSKPLEVDPYRERLFELFVLADAAGLTGDEADPDLSADGLCRELADRWGLREATVDAFQGQGPMSPDQLRKMRSLWSLMRMWMEWTYAWRRWEEFHRSGSH